MTAHGLTRVLLVGFMGAGKTSVGSELADRLGWRFIDFDEEIEAESGRSIPALFDEIGEAGFRRIEERVGERLLREEGVVLGAGGGWAAAPGRLRELPAGTAAIWLRVSPELAVERIGRQPGVRPLLDVDDPLDEARVLLERRVASYRDARWAVDTDRSTVEDVTARILEILVSDYPEMGRE